MSLNRHLHFGSDAGVSPTLNMPPIHTLPPHTHTQLPLRPVHLFPISPLASRQRGGGHALGECISVFIHGISEAMRVGRCGCEEAPVAVGGGWGGGHITRTLRSEGGAHGLPSPSGSVTARGGSSQFAPPLSLSLSSSERDPPPPLVTPPSPSGS
jgi:hypothetical protein